MDIGRPGSSKSGVKEGSPSYGGDSRDQTPGSSSGYGGGQGSYSVAATTTTTDVVAAATPPPGRHEPQGGGGGSYTVAAATATTDTIAAATSPSPSRYESQKRRDWNTFQQYLKNHKPPLALSRCNGAHIIEFLKYLDQFGKTKVHITCCPYFGQPNPPAPCACPLKQAWGSLDALIGRLRAAYDENGGRPDSNPFGARAVRIYLREVKETQAKARGIPYEKKKRKRASTSTATVEGGGNSGAQGGSGTG